MKLFDSSERSLTSLLIDRKPCATANVTGNSAAPGVCGTVRLYTTPLGVVVTAEIGGLPNAAPRASYRVCFRDRKRLTALPCAPDGRCGELTHRFSVEDVLGCPVGVYRDGDDDEPIAVGEVRAAAF